MFGRKKLSTGLMWCPALSAWLGTIPPGVNQGCPLPLPGLYGHSLSLILVQVTLNSPSAPGWYGEGLLYPIPVWMLLFEVLGDSPGCVSSPKFIQMLQSRWWMVCPVSQGTPIHREGIWVCKSPGCPATPLVIHHAAVLPHASPSHQGVWTQKPTEVELPCLLFHFY